MAHLPVPGVHLRPPPGAALEVPAPVRGLLERLWEAGYAGYVVGGSLRDLLLGREPADWDLATNARPEQMLELFPGAAYENQFGTVGVRLAGELFEITTFRSEHDYADFRRPHRVEFGDSIELDLARRDFTINAMAWGADGPSGGATQSGAESPAGGRGGTVTEPALVDPFGGQADLERRVLRAVGEPVARFEEDALRMFRAVRLAAVLAFEIDPATLDAMTARSGLASHLSGERIAAELVRLLAAPRPSVGLELLARTGLLASTIPELAEQRGISQDKIPGDDLWAHTMRTVDAAPGDRPIVRLAALLHDIGKPATQADGRFVGHDSVGAEIADAVLRRLKMPRALADRVVHLVRNHMFSYEAGWSDAAVRRFIRRIGVDAVDDLLLLRHADDTGSGRARDASLDALRSRIAGQLEGDVALDRADLAVDGRDLIEALGLVPGPRVGRILAELLDRVLADPGLNDRSTLLLLARSMLDHES